MTGLTDFITEAQWRDLLLVWYVLVDDAYQALAAFHGREGRPRRRGPQPSFSDSEVITVALCIDTLFDGHEERGLSFVRQYHHDLFPRLLPNGQFNARRRALTGMIEQIRQYLTHRYDLIDPADEVRLVDSAPLPVCTYARAPRSATLAGAEYYSVMSCRKAKLFGLRLPGTTPMAGGCCRWRPAVTAQRMPAPMRRPSRPRRCSTGASGAIRRRAGPRTPAPVTRCVPRARCHVRR